MWKSAFRFVVLLGLQGMYTAIEETLYFVLSEMSNSTPICTYPSFEEMLAVNSSDEGNYKCQCVFHGGTNFTNISVSYKEFHASMTEEGPYPNVMMMMMMMGGLAVTMVAVVFVGVTLKKIHLWKLHQQNCVPSTEFQEVQDIEPYSTFIQTTNGLYSTVQLDFPCADDD
ncbi:uncharacterized protein LOC124474499 isoform X3 [Hypomesus transpacificus]|uniref:uncharacterized protein LOC124474499 isoform X3 n=1 Tax=Hypomesus transpacificus TaxID=137520 RepID=UPI001F087721|nr:uncharacterized protein LOC124474499 isoform X3 [Hypomesus transpacificus]